MNTAHKTLTYWPTSRIFYLAITIWTVLVLASLLTQREQMNRTAISLAKIDAIANLKKDMSIRKWASNVDGVFIREEHVPPFNSLEEELRVTVTQSDGTQYKLVKVTPIHLILAIQKTSRQEFGIEERLTSKQLRNIENAPDDWEEKALDTLDKGSSDVVMEAMPNKRGHGLMRVMIPMRMEEECLECHRDTLVPIGGLRGGAAISINLNSYRSAQEPAWKAIQYWHLGIWVLGLTGISIFQFFAQRRAAELVRQEETQRENEAAFSAMAEGAVITDANAIILWVNDAFCRISGFSREEVIGRNPSLFKSGRHDTEFYRALWEQLTRQGHWRGELWNKKKNGEIFPEEISIQALRAPNGKIRRYISIFSDITERKKNEQELEKYREHLEDLVRQRTEELTIARDQSEAANRSKSIFLANMNHELRTPLNAVIGFSQLMEKDDSLSPKQQHNLEIINTSGHHLLTLINDILELSKIESEKMEMMVEDVAPTELLEQVVAMMQLRAEQSGLSLRLETTNLPPVVTLDPVMLRQVLLNLLSNAIKFTPKGEVVAQVTASTPQEDGQVHLTFNIRDTGIGISSEDCKRIFSSFEQIGPSNQGGTGLGLTISRKYVHMMGGELHVESEPGKGSTFHFSITVHTRQTPIHKQEVLNVTGLMPEDRGYHILVVDQIPEARLLVRSLLEPLELRVSEAATLEEARSTMVNNPPDLVLIDWFLPDGNGLDFLKTIRADQTLSQPRLVMLTANALEENRQQALAARANDFLSKPFQKKELYRILEQQLNLHFIWEHVHTSHASNHHQHPSEIITALKDLPPNIRENLVQAAISLNPKHIAHVLEEVSEENPTLAEYLEKISTSRQYRNLWQLLGILEKGEE